MTSTPLIWISTLALTLTLLLLPYNKAAAQKEAASLISIGHTDLLDTYLSQEKATGLELRYTKEKANRKNLKTDSTATMPRLRRWSTYIVQEAFFTKAGTRGNDNSFLGALYNLRFGWHYNIDLLSPAPACESYASSPRSPLNLRIGLLTDLSLGGLYNTRNSNNPAQARMALSLDPSVMATWRFHLKGRPFTLRYVAAAPALGIAFSPNYGQSYYEIFTHGNYDHNIVFTSPASGLQLHQMLILGFRLWHTSFSIGYLGDIRQMSVNSLKYHQYTHALTIGWMY